MNNHIELNRHFIDFSEEENSEEAIQRSYFRMFGGKDSNTYWDDLLKSKVIVMLGEAGSGKTWELREQAKKVKEKQSFSFFIRLDKLVNNSLYESIDSKDEILFNKWKTSNEEGVFFIDSVDEAKLIKNEAFHDALQKFIKGIGLNNVNRVKAIISGRISEWRGQSDKLEVCNAFNVHESPEENPAIISGSELETKEEKIETFRIVLLAPLQEEQVRILANKHKLNDVDEFIAQVEGKHAWEFVTRPLDAINLFAYWSENKKLGNRQEIIEYTIPLKLTEREERIVNEELSPEKIRSGAETLAAAVIFCKEYNIQIPDSGSITNNESLNIDILLPGWTPNERKFLRNRSIFDGATYGHIRFHHRTTTEYLCACWLQNRMHEQLAYSDIENILFVKSHERWVVKPTMGSIAAWLATLGNNNWNNRIRFFLINNCPEIFLRYGEPHNLSKSDLIMLLQSIVKHYEGRDFVHLQTENYQLSAIAQPKIANEIGLIILDKKVASDIRCDLIIAVWRGRLLECSEILISIIGTKEKDELKRYAVLAIKDIATHEQLERIYQIVSALKSISSLLCSYLCEALYPNVITPIQLWELVNKSACVPKRSGSDMPYYLSRIIKDADIPCIHYQDLLKGIIDLVIKPPHIIQGKTESNISIEYAWAGEILLEIIVVILQQDKVDETLYELLIDGLIVANAVDEFDRYSHRGSDLKSRLNNSLNNHPQLRRLYVWRQVDFIYKENKKLSVFRIFVHYSVVNIQESDMKWILNDLHNPESSIRYKQAFELASEWFSRYKYPYSIKNKIRKFANNREMRKQFSKRNPIFVVRFYFRLKFKFTDKYYWKHKVWNVRSKIKTTYNYIYDRIWILSHILSLRKGNYSGALYNLTHLKNDESDLDKYDWRNLIKPYGRFIAIHIRQGWINSWRKYTPELPYPHTSRTYGTEIGQAGIYNDLLLGTLDFSYVSTDEALLLTRYAVHWLNGFPIWLNDLSMVQANCVQEIIFDCIKNEWGYPKEKEHYYGIASNISYADKYIQKLIVLPLLGLLEKSDPLNMDILNCSLKTLLLNKSLVSHELSNLSQLRLSEYKISEPQYLLWLITLIQVDGNKAILIIKSLINSKELPDLIVDMSAQLDIRHGSHKLVIEDPSYRNAHALCELIPIIFQYVRTVDDIDRSGGGSYSPNQRDAAQSFRGDLLHWLSTSNDSKTYEYLYELLTAPSLLLQKDYILHLIDNRVIHDAESYTWKQEQIAEFEKKHESTPHSNHDLYNLIRKRMLNIKDYIERHDSSPRRTFSKDDNESELRKWLTEQLNQRSSDYYVVEQEVEVDLNKSPDIRISAPGIDPVSIEIKWADKGRSVTSLKQDLENQLVGQYLRTPNSNYGVFLMGNHGLQSYWKDPDDNSIQLSFNDVVEILESLARKLEEENSNVYGLLVIGIDFTVESL